MTFPRNRNLQLRSTIMKNTPITILKTERLTDQQREQARELTALCCRHDGLHLSYPTDESDNCHWLLFADGTILAAALTVLPLEEGLAECIAFTHPDHRRRGYFSELLENAMNQFEEWNLLFPISGSCPDTLAVLDCLGAELSSCELQMEATLPADTKLPITAEPSSTSEIRNVPNDISLQISPQPDGSCLFSLLRDNAALGSCMTTPVSDDCVCLHQVEIHEEFRGQGLAYAMLTRLFKHLTGQNISRVILQVSGENETALRLYKKTGFRITETLSYYLY